MRQTNKAILIFMAVIIVVLKVYVLDQYISLRNYTCPSKHIITVIDGGKLGNNIWEYMSLFAVTQLYKQEINLIAYCPEILKAKLEYVFETLSIEGDSKMPRSRIKDQELYFLHSNETFDFIKLCNNSHPILLAKWSARYKEVLEYGIDKFKKEFRFHKKYKQYSYRILNKIKKTFGMHGNVTFVGMHYRGTDYIDLLHRNYNSFNGPPDYKFYLKAMYYFKRKYKNIVFILITIDFGWLKQNLPFLKENNLVINPNQQDYIKDLALLSHCNHSIINYGTFGATAALFAGGITFVHDLKIQLDHRGPTVTMGIAKSLPNWHIL